MCTQRQQAPKESHMGKEAMKDRAKGKTNEAVGAARQQAGKAIDNKEMQAKGANQELKGKAQGKMADARDAADDVKSAARKLTR
jgi:uncharacterized protein YjbJ (UPF0337 family)